MKPQHRQQPHFATITMPVTLTHKNEGAIKAALRNLKGKESFKIFDFKSLRTDGMFRVSFMMNYGGVYDRGSRMGIAGAFESDITDLVKRTVDSKMIVTFGESTRTKIDDRHEGKPLERYLEREIKQTKALAIARKGTAEAKAVKEAKAAGRITPSPSPVPPRGRSA